MARFDPVLPLRETSNLFIRSNPHTQTDSNDFSALLNSLNQADSTRRAEPSVERKVSHENSPTTANRTQRAIQGDGRRADSLRKNKPDQALQTDQKGKTPSTLPGAERKRFTAGESKSGDDDSAVNRAESDSEEIPPEAAAFDDKRQILPGFLNMVASDKNASAQISPSENTAKEIIGKENWTALLSGILLKKECSTGNQAIEEKSTAENSPLLNGSDKSSTISAQMDKIATFLQPKIDQYSQLLAEGNQPEDIALNFAADIRTDLLELFKDPTIAAQIQETISHPGFFKRILELFSQIASPSNLSKEIKASNPRPVNQPEDVPMGFSSLRSGLASLGESNLAKRPGEAPEGVIGRNIVLDPSWQTARPQSHSIIEKMDSIQKEIQTEISSNGKENLNQALRGNNPIIYYEKNLAGSSKPEVTPPRSELPFTLGSKENQSDPANPPLETGNKSFSESSKKTHTEFEKNNQSLNKAGTPVEPDFSSSLIQGESKIQSFEREGKTGQSLESWTDLHSNRLGLDRPQTLGLASHDKGLEPGGTLNRMEKTEVFAQIIDKARLISGKNQSEIVVSLKPEFLGKVSLRATMVDHELVATIQADSKQVRTLLENELPALRSSLQEQGIQVSKIVVVQESGLSFADWNQGNTASHQQFKSSSNTVLPYPDSNSMDETDGSEAETLLQTLPISAGAVNLVA